ncbi:MULTISPECIES: dUTP diphosphatase [Sulfurospirillum]|jgi:dimeric dUTPase (all-alpha-NTP-PPase superfamily)|uniref:dUTPase n=1 Tax=Sulfurospirillum TaxID=57665 RepID=UPI0005AB39F3|nr:MULTISPECIES: dUTP diphosphatase [Sulfurospirillum]MCP3652588.1 dUTP diphosphatase [Sulfurospirillum sp. DNRA8]MCR1811439.1 dUTP diphosphatase [Sulfurospirillum sp. DNRA8]
MTSKEYLFQMFSLQQKLNDETNGIGWENGYTKHNRLINWKRCIYMECAELIDSFSWKHWKNINKETDWDNVTVEIVDIWHFVMSLLLEEYKTNLKGDLDQLIHDVLDVQGFEAFTKEPLLTASTDPMELINDIENIVHEMTGFDVDLFDGLLRKYFALARKCGINLKVLYKFYVAKNVLNQFRQDHGYKEGSYKKVWNGKEDNEVMLSFLDAQDVPGTEALYKRLEKAYAKA